MTLFNPTDLRNRIEKLGDLPTLPHVVQRLAAMISRPTVSTEEIGAIIEKDQVLAAKVLRLANSPFYGFPSRIGSVSHAVIVLGFNVVKGLTLCASALETQGLAPVDAFKTEFVSVKGASLRTVTMKLIPLSGGVEQIAECQIKRGKVVGAEIQSITYNQWLPSLLGNHGLSAYSGYDSNVNPHMSTEFTTAAFRFGHTMLNDELLRFDAKGNVLAGGHLSLAQSFFNPSLITEPGSLDAVMRGLAYQQANEIDTQVIDNVRNMLFGPPGAGGLDLLSLNIQRGRDHGLADYNSLREDMGLVKVTSFGEITSDPTHAANLAAAYGSVDNIDPWIGLMSEDHLPGASVGETMAAIFVDQFFHLREGDFYFYLNDPMLAGMIGEIEGTSLADILLRNTGINYLQGNIFVVPAPTSVGVLALGGLLAARRRRSA